MPRVQRPRRPWPAVTNLWFIVLLLVATFPSHHRLLFDPVNAWTATLIRAIGLDLASAHAARVRNGRQA